MIRRAKRVSPFRSHRASSFFATATSRVLRKTSAATALICPAITTSSVLRAELTLLAFLALILPARAGSHEHADFSHPERVTIRGYDADAMEPFITKDGTYLFFNNSNDPKNDTNLFYAARVDDTTFDYRGPIGGVNSAALDAVPSMDRSGQFYFISTRSYAATLSTVYRGHFHDGVVDGISLVEGISPRIRGIVNFDAEISGDGNTLVFVDGRFSGRPFPDSARLVMAIREGSGFRRLRPDADPFVDLNGSALQYAPCLSEDGLELFFTRAERGKLPEVFQATRSSPGAPFGAPRRIAAITGFAEAPTLTADGLTLYYHLREQGRFVIYRVTRPH